MSTTPNESARRAETATGELVESFLQSTVEIVERQDHSITESIPRHLAKQLENLGSWARQERLLEIAKAEHAQVKSHTFRAVEHARRAGEALLVLKIERGHGGWTSYLEKHFRKSARTARAYMLIASNWQSIAKTGAASIAQALATAKELRPPRKSSSPKTIEAEVVRDPHPEGTEDKPTSDPNDGTPVFMVDGGTDAPGGTSGIPKVFSDEVERIAFIFLKYDFDLARIREYADELLKAGELLGERKSA